MENKNIKTNVSAVEIAENNDNNNIISKLMATTVVAIVIALFGMTSANLMAQGCDCLPFGVSNIGWRSAEANNKLFSIRFIETENKTQWIDVVPYYCYRRTANNECEIIICKLTMETNMPNADNIFGRFVDIDPTDFINLTSDSILNGTKRIRTLGDFIDLLYTIEASKLLDKIMGHIAVTLDICDQGNNKLNPCSSNNYKVTYQVFDASCKSQFFYDFLENVGHFVSKPCTGSGHCKYKYEFCYEETPTGRQAKQIRTVLNGNSSVCSDKFEIPGGKFITCSPITCFVDKVIDIDIDIDIKTPFYVVRDDFFVTAAE